MLPPQLLPGDINAEILLSYYPKGACKVSLKGLHKRNTYQDIIEMTSHDDDSFLLTIGRNSLYNVLPEYMFHPIDRFDNLPKYEEKERFEEQLDQQHEEMENAYRFFAPIDTLLIWLRTEVRERVEKYATEDIVMQQIIGDRLSEQQRSNRFIRKLLPFLPLCKTIRGNKTLLVFLLRKIFMEEGMTIEVCFEEKTMTDEQPRYQDGLDMEIGNGYVGNTFSELVTTYIIHYWSDDECDSHFMQFTREVEELRLFLMDYFLSVEEKLHFDISHDEPALRLGDDIFYNYLNYNTNI